MNYIALAPESNLDVVICPRVWKLSLAEIGGQNILE